MFLLVFEVVLPGVFLFVVRESTVFFFCGCQMAVFERYLSGLDCLDHGLLVFL